MLIPEPGFGLSFRSCPLCSVVAAGVSQLWVGLWCLPFCTQRRKVLFYESTWRKHRTSEFIKASRHVCLYLWARNTSYRHASKGLLLTPELGWPAWSNRSRKKSGLTLQWGNSTLKSSQVCFQVETLRTVLCDSSELSVLSIARENPYRRSQLPWLPCSHYLKIIVIIIVKVFENNIPLSYTHIASIYEQNMGISV